MDVMGAKSLVQQVLWQMCGSLAPEQIEPDAFWPRTTVLEAEKNEMEDAMQLRNAEMLCLDWATEVLNRDCDRTCLLFNTRHTWHLHRENLSQGSGCQGRVARCGGRISTSCCKVC